MRRVTASLLLLTLLLPPAAGWTQQAGPAPEQVGIFLQPGDLVRVQVYREDELNGEFPVDPDGIVVLPLIGPQRVTDVPVRILRDQLVEEYRVHLRNPSITITPLRRVNILGEVQRPGLYPIDPTISLAGAVALAGGTTQIGNLNRIRVLRGDEVIHGRLGVSQTLSAADIRSGDQIIVERRSWFDRNSTFVVSALLSFTSIVTSIIIAARRS